MASKFFLVQVKKKNISTIPGEDIMKGAMYNIKDLRKQTGNGVFSAGIKEGNEESPEQLYFIYTPTNDLELTENKLESDEATNRINRLLRDRTRKYADIEFEPTTKKELSS